MTKHSNGSPVTRLDAASIALFEQQLRESHLSRRQLLGRGLALGLALPAAGALGSRAVSAASLQTPSAEKGGDGTLIITISGDPLSFNPDFQVDDNGFAPCSN